MNEDGKSVNDPSGGHGGSSVSDHFHPKRRKAGKAWAWVLTALACVAAGAVIGVGLTILHYKDKTFPRPPPAKEMTAKILKRVNETVTLTGEENARIEAIILEHMEAVRRIRRESWQSIRKQFDAMNRSFAEVLDPERHREWREAVEKRRLKRKRGLDQDNDSRSGNGAGGDPRPQ